MKILWLANVPSPYRVDFFNLLGQSCELTVLFEKGTSNERDSSWKKYSFDFFEGIILNGISTACDSALCINVIKYLKKYVYDYIIVTDFTSLTGMLAIEYMRMRGIQYCLESDGGFAKNGKGFKERIKRHFIKGANLYFSTGRTNDAYFIKYGAKEDRLVRYPFSSIYDKDILKNPITKSEQLEIRSGLSMKESKIVLAVGQFIHRKGFDLLLSVSNCVKDVGFYFVGGQPTEEYLNIVCQKSLDNVHFVGFKSKKEIAEYYKAADFFVLPTREDIWGLVINEAMSYGLPIITTDKCAAGLELVEDGVNGYIVPNENIDALQVAIVDLLKDDSLVKKMSHASLEKIKDYTLERMADIHLDVLQKNQIG